DAATRGMRQDGAARAGRVGGGNAHELEVEGVVVVQDQEAILTVDDRMIHVILDALAAWPDDERRRSRLCGINEVAFGGDVRADADHDEPAAARESGAHPEAFIALVEKFGVLADRSAQAVEP